jgi:hypothetical protein
MRKYAALPAYLAHDGRGRQKAPRLTRPNQWHEAASHRYADWRMLPSRSHGSLTLHRGSSTSDTTRIGPAWGHFCYRLMGKPSVSLRVRWLSINPVDLATVNPDLKQGRSSVTRLTWVRSKPMPEALQATSRGRYQRDNLTHRGVSRRFQLIASAQSL